MQYDPPVRRYSCKSCGLSLSSQELMELRDRLRPERDAEDSERQKRRKDYLDWWFSRRE